MAVVSVEACQIIGKQQFDLENMRAEYMRLLSVLAALKTGEIEADQVIVNLEPPGFWQVIDKPKKNGVHNRLAKNKV